MLDILQQIRGYSPNLENCEQNLKCKSIPIVGDQLTVERGVNIIEAVQNSFTIEEKLEGVHMEIADWHTAVTFLNVSRRGGVSAVLPRTSIGLAVLSVRFEVGVSLLLVPTGGEKRPLCI